MTLLLFFLTLALSNNPSLPKHTLPIYGNTSLGYYYVTIFVGHPPQKQSVIIDTGSGQLALPCNKCPQCNPKHIDTPFDMSKSKTAKYVTCGSKSPACRRCVSNDPTEPCKFSISYAEGSSLQGIIIKDYIQFESFSQGEEIQTNFGCTTKQTNLFLSQAANGIFGLAPERYSRLLEDLYQKHHGYSGQEMEFSLCLGNNGGYMAIGKIQDNLHIKNQSIKTTFSSKSNLFSLNNVGDILIGNSLIHRSSENFGPLGIFLDSGSTFTYFPHQNCQILKAELRTFCQQSKQACIEAHGQTSLCFHLKGNITIDEMVDKIFPSIVFNIGDQKIQWKSKRYFLMRDITNKEICLSIEVLDRFLLGANWMIEKDIAFNLKEKTVQIFPEAVCSQIPNIEVPMSQYLNQSDGNSPLDYKNGYMMHQEKVTLLFIFGIMLIIMGILGLISLLMRRNSIAHKLIPTTEPIDQRDITQLSTENSIKKEKNIESSQATKTV